MIRAKNYERVSKFVKVMTKILWPLFSGHGVVSVLHQRTVHKLRDDLQLSFSYDNLRRLRSVYHRFVFAVDFLNNLNEVASKCFYKYF